jgi:hypothetical protein
MTWSPSSYWLRFAHSKSAAQPGIKRHAATAGLEIQAGEAVDARGGEAPRQLELLGGQDVDGVMAAAREGRHRQRRAAQAPQHQRRVQAHRVEAVGGQADRHPVGGARGDDGDPGGEQAEGGAEFLRVGHGSL